MRRLLSTLMLLSGLFGVAFAQAPSPRGLLVRVHVFSGRKDPEFRITDPAEIAKVMAILQANAAEDTKAPSQEVLTHNLGYRGIEVLADSGVPGLGSISAFAVNKGRIQVHRQVNGASKSTLHQDAAAELEAYLLERGMAQGHIETKVVQRVRAQR